MLTCSSEIPDHIHRSVQVVASNQENEHLSDSWTVLIDHMERGVSVGTFEERSLAEEVAFVLRYELARIAERSLATRRFIDRCDTGMSIVASSSCSAEEIEVARRNGRMLVTEDGMGYVLRRKDGNP